MKPLIASTLRALSRAPAIGLALGLSLLANASFAQLVDISNTPLYGGRQPHPNVAVSLSVEFPTVGSAFRNVTVYDRTVGYLGYFDPTKCYAYTSGPPGFFFRRRATPT